MAMDTKKLRQADFVTSIVMILFGVWVLIQAFGMPMRDTYGGVRNVWYVSPALLPLVIGGAIAILGTVLLINSIKVGGAADFMASMKQASLKVSEANQRFIAVLLGLLTFVYLYVPRVDFFMSIAFFLAYCVPAFAIDSMRALRRLSVFYAAVSLLMIIVFATPIAGALNALFQFATDVIILIATIAITIYARRLSRETEIGPKRFRTGLIVTVVTPLVLTPVFRFFLLVPLPHEGGIVQLMQLIYYSIR